MKIKEQLADIKIDNVSFKNSLTENDDGGKVKSDGQSSLDKTKGESIYDQCKFHNSASSGNGNMNILPRYIRNPGAKEPEDETYVNGLFVDANLRITENKTIINAESDQKIGNIIINTLK